MSSDEVVSTVIEKIKKTLASKTAPTKSVKVLIKEGGVIFASADKVASEDLPADATLTISAENLMALANRKMNAQLAFVQGKLKLSGDPGAALQWLPILQS